MARFSIYQLVFLCGAALAASCTEMLQVTPGQYEDHSRDISKMEMTHIAALANPERGFNLESNFFAADLSNPWHEGGYPDYWIPAVENSFNTSKDGLTLTQLTLYLTQYVGKDLDQAAFDNMQTVFDNAKERGYKMHLTFAYDHNAYATSVNFNDIFRHLEQLEPFIEKNIGMIDIWKMGFIGAWGEGHSSAMSSDWTNKTKLIQEILKNFPDRFMSLRYPRQMANFTLTEAEKKRVGFSNDFFTASEHPLAGGNDYTFGSTDYDMVAQAGPYVKVCGEIPYNEDTEWGLGELVSVQNTIKIFKEHHYDAFDVTQNNELNIASWKYFRIYPEWCHDNRILYDESYFVEEDGRKVARSAYEFIRDHLGYRLYADKEDVLLSVNGGSIDFDIPIRNVGFSAILNPRPVYIVLVDDNGNVAYEEKLAANPKEWQPYDVETKEYKALVHHIKGSITSSLTGKFKVGLWLPDPTEQLHKISKYAIQFANTELLENQEYRINIISEVTL